MLRAELEAARETVRLVVAENETLTAVRDDGLEREASLQRDAEATQVRFAMVEQALQDMRVELSSASRAERIASENLVRAEVRLEQLKDVEAEARRQQGRNAELEAACAQLRSSLSRAEGQRQVLEERLRGQTERADECRQDNAVKTAALDVERQRRQVAEAEVTRVTRLREQWFAVAPGKVVEIEGKLKALAPEVAPSS